MALHTANLQSAFSVALCRSSSYTSPFRRQPDLAHSRADAITVETALTGDADGKGLRAMFWDIAFGGHVTAHGAQATIRQAAAAAASRCHGDADGTQWRNVRNNRRWTKCDGLSKERYTSAGKRRRRRRT